MMKNELKIKKGDIVELKTKQELLNSGWVSINSRLSKNNCIDLLAGMQKTLGTIVEVDVDVPYQEYFVTTYSLSYSYDTIKKINGMELSFRDALDDIRKEIYN
jgi:hypothetical protein